MQRKVKKSQQFNKLHQQSSAHIETKAHKKQEQEAQQYEEQQYQQQNEHQHQQQNQDQHQQHQQHSQHSSHKRYKSHASQEQYQQKDSKISKKDSCGKRACIFLMVFLIIFVFGLGIGIGIGIAAGNFDGSSKANVKIDKETNKSNNNKNKNNNMIITTHEDNKTNNQKNNNSKPIPPVKPVAPQQTNKLNPQQPQPVAPSQPVTPVKPPQPVAPVNPKGNHGPQKPFNQTFSQMQLIEYEKITKINIALKLNNTEKTQNQLKLTENSSIIFSQANQTSMQLSSKELQQLFAYIKKRRQTLPPLYCPQKTWQDNRNVKMYEKRYTLVNTRYNFKMYIDGYDKYISMLIHRDGVWQKKIIFVLGKLMKPGYKILNLGAQSGIQAIIMGKLIGPEGKIYVFQPYSISYNILEKNIQMNNLKDRVELFRVGAHDHKFKTDLYISYRNTAGNTIISSSIQDKNDYYTEQIQLDKVDDILPPDVKIDFALIDVERVQVEALNGMKKLLQRTPNLILFVQWSNKSDKKATKEMAEYFFKKQYRIYTYKPDWTDQCKIGVFTQINLPKLLSFIYATDVWFFPKGINPPK